MKLLSYTPPLQRDLVAPWKRNDVFTHAYGDIDQSVHCWWVLDVYQRGGMSGALAFCDAEPEHFRNGTFEDLETVIRFAPGRSGWRAAWSLLRALRNERSSMHERWSWDVLEIRPGLYHLPRHQALLGCNFFGTAAAASTR